MPQNQNTNEKHVNNQKVRVKKHLTGFLGTKMFGAFVRYNEKKSREQILEREWLEQKIRLKKHPFGCIIINLRLP